MASMKRYIFYSIVLWSGAAWAQSNDGWNVFARVKFNPKFFKELNEYFLVPVFDSQIRALEGKEITLRGHYIPMELNNGNVIILSKYSYSQCFFCGGAGPESVAEIVFPSKHPKLKADQIITVKGTLQLNDADVEHMNFIMREASLITK
jgi:hypothetical protein